MFAAFWDDPLRVAIGQAANTDDIVVAPVAARPPRPRRDNGRAGVAHRESAITRIRVGLAKHYRTLADTALGTMRKITSPDFSNHIARVCFGRHSPEDQQIIVLAGGGHTTLPMTQHGGRSSDHRMCMDYGLLSSVRRQARGLCSFVACVR